MLYGTSWRPSSNARLKHHHSISRIVIAVIVVIIVAAAGLATASIFPSNTKATTTSSTLSTRSSPASSSSSSTTSVTSKLTPFTFGFAGPLGAYSATMYQAGLSLNAWQKYGLNVSLIAFTTGNAALFSAMNTGQIQVGDGVTLALIPAFSSGANIKLFALDLVDNAWAIAVPANSNITSISQMKASKSSISISNVGSGTWSATLLIMAAAGMKQGVDYSLASLGTSSAAYAAMIQGRVQATTLPIPLLKSLSGQTHTQIRLIANSSVLYPKPWADEGFISTTQFIQQHPDMLKAFVNGYIDTYNYFKSNSTWAINFLMKYNNVNQTDAKVIYNLAVNGFTANTAVNPDALQNVRTLAISSGVISGNETIPPISTWYSNCCTSG